MASKSLNLLLNTALATMAIGLVAFNTGLLEPYLSENTANTGANDTQQKTEAVPAAATVDETQPDTGDAAGKDIAAENTKAADLAGDDAGDTDTDIVPPRFDIVRVEPDGNMVIAGNAAAGSTVDVITGSRTLGSAKAGTEGDFAVVLDDPLNPGDYTIVLRATTPGDVIAMSAESAIVSVPETEDGDVLAIVDEPGKPSKLITVPTAEAESETAPENTGAETEVAMAKPAKQDEAVVEPAGSEPGTAEMPDDAASKTAAAGKEPNAEESATEEPAGETATEMAAVETGEAEAQTAAAQPETSEIEPAEIKPAEIEPVETKPAIQLEVAVEAVEIEGDSVFIAGTATPGMVVRVYANKDLIGQTQSSPVGRFLVESNRGLPVGEYIIRADLLEVGSADVTARAAVPFEREAGDSVAAVARGNESETVAVLEETVSGGKQGDQSASSEMAGGDKPADTGGQAAKADISAGAEMPAKAEMDQPDDARADGAAADGAATDNAAAGDAGNQVAAASSGEKTDDMPAADDPASSTQASQDSDNANEAAEAAEPGEIKFAKFDENVALTAPKLEKTSGAVIIRRGDTLWHISRRVYGRGIRYTTIYTANRDQIKNPHRIWPGQIFDVPGESNEGEAADLQAIADRAPDAENTSQANDN